MPCIFCVAVFLALAGAVTAATIDQMEAQLVVDTSSVTKMEFSMAAGGKTVPVALTVMKDARRVRIQLLSHELSKADAEELQDRVAELLDLRVVDRSSPESEGKIHDAFDHQHKDLSPTPAGDRLAALRRRLPFGRRSTG
jgi:DNA-binding protein YbaB